MKIRAIERHTKSAMMVLMTVMVLSACSSIDDDLSNCPPDGTDYLMDYELRLVTNISTEIHTQLGLETNVELAASLREHLSGIFTDFAHDVDLSFYDTVGDSLRLEHDQHIMDASQQSYKLHLPMHDYMHLAVANLVNNPLVSLKNDERCHPSHIENTTADTISSHTTGLFTARLPMKVKEGVNQSFHVRLYMANCAAALVVDPREYDISSLRVYTKGFASRFNICDSTYTFTSQSPFVRTDKVTAEHDNEVCYVSVNYPSREPKTTRSVIETIEPFISKEGDETLWQVYAYITKADGKITETVLSLRQPLRAGQLKIIKGYVTDEGAIRTDDQTVGVSVTLDWQKGTHHDIPL